MKKQESCLPPIETAIPKTKDGGLVRTRYVSEELDGFRDRAFLTDGFWHEPEDEREARPRGRGRRLD